MMNDLIILITITSIWIIGVKIITYEGMVLEKLGEWAVKQVDNGKIIWEPLVVCAWCMPSVHSIVGYAYGIFLFEIPITLIWMYPIVAMGSSLICGVIWTLVLTMFKNFHYLSNRETLSGWDISDRKRRFKNQNHHQNGKIKKQEHF